MTPLRIVFLVLLLWFGIVFPLLYFNAGSSFFSGPIYKGKNILEWIDVLEHGDRVARIQALDAIEAIPPPFVPEKVVPVLVKTLGDESPVLRARAAHHLAMYGSDLAKFANIEKQIYPRLIDLLTDKNSSARLASARCLEAIGLSNPKVIVALKAAFGDSDESVRVQAARSYAKLTGEGKLAFKVLLKTSLHAKKNITVGTVEALGAIGCYTNTPEITNLLMKYLSHEDSDIQEKAIDSLGNLGSKAVKAIPSLLRLVKHQNPTARKSALSALQSIRRNDKLVIDCLVERLKSDTDASVRLQALWQIEQGEFKTPEVISVLVSSLDDPAGINRGKAAEVLGLFRAKESLPKLLQAVHDGEWFYRWKAALAIGAIGVASPEVERALKNLQNDTNEDVRRAASRSVRILGL